MGYDQPYVQGQWVNVIMLFTFQIASNIIIKIKIIITVKVNALITFDPIYLDYSH